MINFGDVIRIGNHTLLCGDATEKLMVSTILNKKTPQLMVTDPPYGVKLVVRDRKSYKDKPKDVTSPLEDLRVRNDHRTNWSKAFYLSRAKVAYIWHASSAADTAMQAIRDGDYEPRQSIVWVKNRSILSRSAYHWKHESAIYAVRIGEIANWLGNRKQSTVWDADVPATKDRIHPTQKPEFLYLRPIENHTSKGDIVYDPFAGSGTIFVAAEKSQRRAIGVEIDPKLCERIVDRMTDMGLKSEVLLNVFS